MDSTLLNERIRRQQALENQVDALVKLAEQTINAQALRGLKNSQFNNLLGVALETNSPAVVVNWLSYQMGRRTPDTRPWAETGLGDRVINDVKGLEERARTMAADKNDAEAIRELHIQLTRQYLGYLKRWFIAKGGR